VANESHSKLIRDPRTDARNAAIGPCPAGELTSNAPIPVTLPLRRRQDNPSGDHGAAAARASYHLMHQENRTSLMSMETISGSRFGREFTPQVTCTGKR
jgi:hypothetical protein